MYDATDRESFENIANWTDQIEQVGGWERMLFIAVMCFVDCLGVDELSMVQGLVCMLLMQHADAGVSKVLIGNKCDMVGKIQVTEAEGRALAQKYDIPFYLASAKNNFNVTEVSCTAGSVSHSFSYICSSLVVIGCAHVLCAFHPVLNSLLLQ